ncbi:BRCA2-interacting transcriptional repressor EMSY isoform X2 [Belonocnema kinseyi]|uniref:BRCA2-interacting transcriptional repressor EMSY isoform X2 n=1 Tax=Belonocnema kinseyi TaxID=2817044 RepID=UPI00143CD27F|nr:BRCA2-interacting transcriptional repressor EMSY isoform X2 [Belonocnema kinseyi]
MHIVHICGNGSFSLKHNSAIMLPGKLEMSRDECRKYLRSLELDAYASMVSVLRAQGPFTNDKRKLLEELAGVLHISNERHRAEIRRAVNDDKLTTVAEQLSGPNTGTDWATEGRRIVPLLPRLKGRTAFTALANTLSLVTAIANKQQPRVEERAEDSRLKMETDSDIQQICSSEEESSGSSSREPEINFNDRKRKRSLTESSDTEGSTCSKSRVKEKSEFPVVANSSKEELKFPSFPSCSKVEPISPSSLRHNICNNTSMENIIRIPSSTNIVTTNITVISSGMSNIGTNSTDPCKNASNITTAQTNQYISESIPTVKSKVNVSSSPVKAAVVSQKRISVTMPSSSTHPTTSDKQSELKTAQMNSDEGSKVVPVTNHVPKIDISRSEDASTSKPCVKKIEAVVQTCANTNPTEKPAISNIATRLTSECPESTTSSGPGPPSVKSSSPNLTCKTLPPVKPNNHPPVKMTSLISKATTLNSQPNARFGSKRNFIVLQKGMKEVKLSHGGKEVIGKVIGNNFRFANQPNQSSVTPVPRLPPNNGDHSDPDCLKPNKSGNMILLDIRPEVIEKSKVFSQSFETFDTEAKTATGNPTLNFTIKDQRNNGPSIIEKDSQLNDSSASRVSNENEESFVYEDTDITKALEKAVEKEPLFICNDEGTLDPQTGIYEIQSSGLFKSTLTSENINLESSECMEGENRRCVSEEARNSIESLEEFDELGSS